MSTSPRWGGRLRPFRLTEIPLDLRVRAAGFADRARDTTPATVDPTDRLFGRLLSDRAAGGDTGDVDVLRDVARNPSDRVYWIRLEAYERVMGER